MILRRIGWEVAVLAVLVVLCIALVFFFPTINGPYSAVNGPVTALQSAQAAARLRVAIVRAAFTLIQSAQIPPPAGKNFIIILRIEPDALASVDGSMILRC
jgi:hypothetical protein